LSRDDSTTAGRREVDADDPHRRALLDRIEKRRAAIDQYLRKMRPRGERLSLIGVVASTVSAVLVAGPAVGGDSFSGVVQGALGLPKESTVWQVLCLMALVVSVVAALAGNLVRSEDLLARISGAEAAASELEGLTTMLEFGTIDAATGVQLFQQYNSTVSFIDGPTVSAAPL
jgi:hypothetical protein